MSNESTTVPTGTITSETTIRGLLQHMVDIQMGHISFAAGDAGVIHIAIVPHQYSEAFVQHVGDFARINDICPQEQNTKGST